MKYVKEFLYFLYQIYNERVLLQKFIINDFQKKYLGSYLGIIWAFIQPITFIFVIWFVFSVGLRSAGTVDGVPFFLWLITGMVPWFFFNNALSSGTSAIIGHAYLVRRVSFRLSILPIVKIGSALIIHFILLLLLFLILLFSGYNPTIYWLQIFFYLFCFLFLLLGLTWLASSIRVFVKDVDNLVTILLQIGFWYTPIIWTLDGVTLSLEAELILKANPMYYIVCGYRDSLISNVWFWQRPYETLYFFIFVFIFLIIGAMIFRRLRPHFADVL